MYLPHGDSQSYLSLWGHSIDVWTHFVHCSVMAWHAMVAATSTSALGLAIWTFGITASAWLTRRIFLWAQLKNGSSVQMALKKAFSGGLRDAGIELLAIFVTAFIAWRALFPL
jgi:hypothetical protein